MKVRTPVATLRVNLSASVPDLEKVRASPSGSLAVIVKDAVALFSAMVKVEAPVMTGGWLGEVAPAATGSKPVGQTVVAE